MSGKEERIRVLLAKNPCKECKIKKCTRKCIFGLLFEKEPGMTRPDAIEVMAKAIFERQRPGGRGDVPIEDVWNDLKEAYEKLAEAALNALLEGVKK